MFSGVEKGYIGYKELIVVVNFCRSFTRLYFVSDETETERGGGESAGGRRDATCFGPFAQRGGGQQGLWQAEL